MNKLLFLCTGNYYRSRFSEIYFAHLARQHNLRWEADSCGLALDPRNTGPLSHFTIDECNRMKLAIDMQRFPRPLTLEDLERSHRVIAVKEAEHRPLMQRLFPEWADRIDYWHVHDIDFETPDVALPQLRTHVEALIDELRQEAEMSEETSGQDSVASSR